VKVLKRLLLKITVVEGFVLESTALTTHAKVDFLWVVVGLGCQRNDVGLVELKSWLLIKLIIGHFTVVSADFVGLCRFIFIPTPGHGLICDTINWWHLRQI